MLTPWCGTQGPSLRPWYRCGMPSFVSARHLSPLPSPADLQAGERQALLEVIFSRFSQILIGLAYGHDAQLKALGERLHERFQSLTGSQLNFGEPFTNFQQLDCTRYPHILQETLFKALRAELKKLTSRTDSLGSNHSESSGRAAQRPKPLRHGSGG